MAHVIAAALPARKERTKVVKPRGYWGNVWQRLRYDYVTLFCLALIIAIVLLAIFAPLVAPMDPSKPSMAHRLRPIGAPGHLLGTDEQGRDMLSRLIFGGRVSLTMGILPVALATVIGGLLGVVAGYFAGGVNMAIMRTMDGFFAFPSVLLAVAISGSLGGGIGNQLITLTVILIPPLCRVAETATSQVRSMDFVDAARSTVASTPSILVTPVLTSPPSGLSFRGLGVSPPTPDWGLMLSTLRESIYVQPLVSAVPGIAILITSIAFNLVSDGLRQAMDVRA